MCYSTLAAVALWAYGRTHTPWQSRGITLTFCILFGITMELMQMLPWVGRCCSLADIRDNSLGALLSVLLFPVAWWPQGK